MDIESYITNNITWCISGATFVVFTIIQIIYFSSTWRARNIFKSFFKKESKNSEYTVQLCGEANDLYPQIEPIGKPKSDLNNLIEEINIYLFKTKGTSDYEFIRNKVERKLNMRYDQSTVHLSFPTYVGLMGTFCGVFIGILMFLIGFDANNISDESIKNLLTGVLVSMSTSLVGLFLTTWNNARAGSARKKIEDDKNEFYDFIQTDVTKTASASLVSAISKLHDTVDKFEPAFSTVIKGFKEAFNECTIAFGKDFKANVQAVTSAVEIMGENMGKINENIDLQKRLIDTLKSGEFVRGMDKYIEASNHFVNITQSLNKFEEARRMMLAAAQEAISLQNQYSESLKIPREIAVRVNQILDRIKDFENSVNEAGRALTKRDILGNDILNSIQDQIKGISKKGRIADKFLDMADVKLEELYKQQTAVINEMNNRYKAALEGHIVGFESMLTTQTEELEKRHKEFLDAIEERFNVEDVRQEFTNLRKLETIEQQFSSIEKRIASLTSTLVTPENIHSEIQELQKGIKSFKDELKTELSSINKNTRNASRITLFGLGEKK